MEAAGGLDDRRDSAREKPVHTVLSGPAGGVVPARMSRALSGFADIITLDMGGTSTDISLVLDGRPQVTREASARRHADPHPGHRHQRDRRRRRLDRLDR